MLSTYSATVLLKGSQLETARKAVRADLAILLQECAGLSIDYETLAALHHALGCQ